VAVQAGKVDKIRCLLTLGADARDTDLNGNTYFRLAARDGRTEVLEAFIGDVDVTGANNDGDTALHLAAKSGHVDAVKLLLQKSKLDARNKYVMILVCGLYLQSGPEMLSHLFTSSKEAMFSSASVCVFVSRIMENVFTKFGETVAYGPLKKPLDWL